MPASSSASSSLTRASASVIVVSVLVGLTSAYYLYRSHANEAETVVSGTGLRRSNAIHGRRRRRNTTSNDNTSAFLTDSSGDNDEDAQIVAGALTDGETVVDDHASQTDYDWIEPHPPVYQRSGQNIVQLLFRVSEDATRRNAYVHRGCACNSCNMVPIRGIRYRCANCADFDLCEGCESQGFHNKTHIFYKVKVPAPSFGPRNIQPVWYTGDPDTTGRALPKALINKLSRETGFERPELDAYWEQWTFMASTDWRDDPDDINLAMDRKTFERCLVPSGSSKHAAPSLIFDRMFAFYDTNKDDLIGFPEFLHGLAYRKKRDKWKKIFEGYDIDGDGHVDRKDFLRLFRSYYVLFRQMHRDVLEGMDEQQMSSTDAHRLVSSRQPLSGAFGQDGRYPSAPDPRTGEGKTARSNGDLEISDGKGIVNESSDDTGNREDIFRRIDRNPWGSSQSRSGGGYWEAQMNPPISVEQMPDVLRNLSRVRNSVADILSDHPNAHPILRMAEEEENNDDSSSDSEGGIENDENWPPTSVTVTDEDAAAVAGPGTHVADLRGESRAAATDRAMERERTRQEINERWKRRQFYTDEEEGASAPADWKEDDDVLAQIGSQGESSKSQSRPSIHSRSSSKVRFAEEIDDFDTRSNPSTSSRSVPERWGGMEIPDAEKDAGKEILYQVTQQAFNELLDPLFKAKEDAAIEAAETTTDRAKYRHIYDTPWFDNWAKAQQAETVTQEGNPPKTPTITRNPVWPRIPEVEIEQVSEVERLRARILDTTEAGNQVRQRRLSELLDATGYTVEEVDGLDDVPRSEDELAQQTQSTPSNLANDLGAASRIAVQSGPLDSTDYIMTSLRATATTFERTISPYGDDSISPTSTAHATPPSSESSYRDPTLPQFRPNSDKESKSEETKINEFQQVWDEEKETSIINPDPLGFQSPSEASFSLPELNLNSQKSKDEPVYALDQLKGIRDDKSGDLVPKEYLLKLWRADKMEKEKEERGGWGRVNFKEFEKVIKTFAREDGKGNGMDYLGSWIEFCIP